MSEASGASKKRSKSLSEEGWKKLLSKKQYHILREKGTEIPFTGKLLKEKGTGDYLCAGCGAKLFLSKTKFESGTGWPSFWDATENVGKREDKGLFTTRTEVFCKKCNGHLGHVFDDGPKPTGLRYCINSAAMKFRSQAKRVSKPERRSRTS